MKTLFICLLLSLNNPSAYYEKYEETVDFIKKHEGFESCEYVIEGVRTIGYGHTIKKGEKFTCLTQKEAEDLLRKDFNLAINSIDRYLKLEGTRRLAIGHFVYCRGIGSFVKSKLYTKIKNGEPLTESDFTTYRFKSARLYEWNLWKLNKI